MKSFKHWPSAAVIAALLLSVACGGKGCSCVTPIKGGFPTDKRHEGAIQVRATSNLFSYLDQNGAQLVTGLLPGGSTFNVPPQCGSNKVCCGMPAPMCRIQILPQALHLTPTPPDSLHLQLTTQLITLDKLPVEFMASFLGTAKCLVSLDTTKGTAGHTDIDIVGDLQFKVDATTDLTQLTFNNAAVNNLDGSMLTLESQPGDFLCTIANFGPIKTFVVGQLTSQLAGQLQSTVDKQFCMQCMDKTDCNSFATDCKSNVCVGADGKTCIQEVGLDGRMNAGKALASFSPGLQAYLDVLASLGGFARADNGLTLGMLGGGVADPHASCVPKLSPPAAMTIPASTTFDTDVLPDKATPYHVGIGVHVSHLDTLGFAAWDAGALCLNVGTPSVALLSSKTIGVIIPSLGDLTHGGDSPMFLVMRPAEPPTFTMGKGTFKVDPATHAKTVDDPLLHISVPKFSIDFYAFVDERYVRIMTLTSDLALGLSLDVDASGKLVPLLGDVKNGFKHLVITNSELLAESPNDLAASFPTLLGVAVGSLSGSLAPIALPAIMGLHVKPLAITSTDPGPDGNNQFLSIFADLVPAQETLAAETTAQLSSLVLPTTAEFAVNARSSGVEPKATFDLGGRSIAGKELEWSWSLDGGLWSPFSTEPRLELSDPRLWLQGRHHLDVRARAAGLPDTLDSTPARVDFLVDTIAPVGELQNGPAGTIQLVATDNVSPPDALEYRWAIAGQPMSSWTRQAWLDLPADADRELLVVQVRDEAGNFGSLEFHGRTTNPPSTGCGCDLGGAQPSSPRAGALAVLALGIALVLGRRSRRWLALLFCTAALQACNSGLGKGDFESPLDEIGRFSDVAARAGVFHVSAYDDTMGDLVYAHLADPTGQISWQVVDGIDPMVKPDKPGDYRGGVSDPGPDVGLYTSIALTKSGEPRIAYFDRSNGALKFAAGPGKFHTHTVESAADPSIAVGLYAALTLDSNDAPSIAYMATGMSDGMGGFFSELRRAVARTPSPSSSSDWTISKVDTTRISCAGRCAMGKFCIQAAMVNMKPNGDPSISTCTAPDAAPCAPSCSSKQACIKGACTAFLPVVAQDLPSGTGLFARALRSKNDALQIVYYDYPQHSLKLALQSAPGGAFAVSFIDGNDPSVDVGQFAAARLADDGTLHVAYVDAIGDRLLYKTVTGGAAAMIAEVVDDGTRADGPHSVGAGAALILDGGSPRVVYQDQTTASTLQARRASTWSHDNLMSGFAGYGWWPHLISDGTKIWLSQFVYDRQNGTPLGAFQLTALQ